MADTLDTFTEATVIGDTDLLHLKVGTGANSDKKITGANAKTAFNTVDTIQFNTSFADGNAEGRLQWNSADGTLEYGLAGGNVNLQVGQEQVVRVRNNTGSQIDNGAVVYISGSHTSDVPEISLAQADDVATALAAGIATEDIPTAGFGYISTFGLVRDIDTDGFVEGAPIFLSETVAGAYQQNRPVTGSGYAVFIGVVVKAHLTEGEILTHVTIVPRLDRLSGVEFADPTDGQALRFVNANSQYELYDPETVIDFWDTADNSKIASFDLSAITTATTRTITFPDADVDLGDIAPPNFASSVDDETNHNYGIGLNALNSVTVSSGLRNIAIGTDAGTAITTGDDNIYIGHDSGKLGSGSGTKQNVALGNYTLDSQGTNSDQNTAIGHLALSGLSTGDDCTAVGWSAASGATGNNNTAIGSSSLPSATGQDNVAVGYFSAPSISSGTDNVVLGVNAGSSGYSGNALTTGDYCVLIGAGVGPETSTDDYQLVIGAATGVPAISGYMGTRIDVDMSGKLLTISGPSALPAATTNQDGGNLVLQAGQKASGGGTNGFTLANDMVYGIMSVQGGVTGEATVDGTPRKVAAWNTDGIANGCTVDSTTGNDITIDVDGVYEVICQASFSGTNSSVITLEIYKGGVATGFALTRTLGSAGAVGAAGVHGFISCVATDTIELYQSSTGSAMTVEEGQMSVKRISD